MVAWPSWGLRKKIFVVAEVCFERTECLPYIWVVRSGPVGSGHGTVGCIVIVIYS